MKSKGNMVGAGEPKEAGERKAEERTRVEEGIPKRKPAVCADGELEEIPKPINGAESASPGRSRNAVRPWRASS